MKNETTIAEPFRQSGVNLQLVANDITIGYSDVGVNHAPVVIFIHGFPFNRSMWNTQMNELRSNFRVISYDVRGHGESSIGNDDFSINIFVSDLIGLMDQLKIESAIICGLSMGGYIALQAIKQHSTRFLGLVLCDTQCTADSQQTKENRVKDIDAINADDIEAYADANILKLFTTESFKTKQEEVVHIRSIIENTPKETLCKTLMALATREETCESLTKINVPVLILVGREDKITPIAAAVFMHEKIKGSVIHIIDDAAHLSNLENPIAFNSKLHQFLYDRFSKTHL